MRSAAILLVAVTSAVGCTDLVSECQELVVGDTHLVGIVNRLTGESKYVRAIQIAPTQPGGVSPLAYVRVGAHRASLAGATPESLEAAGLPDITTVADRRFDARTFGVNCRKQSVEAFLEIRFIANALQSVVATQFNPGDCDFAVGWRDERTFSLPASGQTVHAALPSPGTLRECRPVF